MRQTKKDQNKKNKAANKKKITVPEKRENPYKKEENHIELYRGTKINRAELF